jgi:hypothetical protein
MNEETIDQACERLRGSVRPLTQNELRATQHAVIQSLNCQPSEKDQLLAVLRQFRKELKAVGRVRDAHLIERAIDRVRSKNSTTPQKSKNPTTGGAAALAPVLDAPAL